MSYKKALLAAGAVIHQYATFGAGQGTWLALVTYRGQCGFASGKFGSCGSCDAFKGEFENAFDENRNLAETERLRRFGESYLDTLYTFVELRAQAMQTASWNSEAEDLVVWLDTECDQLLARVGQAAMEAAHGVESVGTRQKN